MALAPGTRLGPYEVLAPLGAGGMGEVYRARDTRLQRDVAVKVLPAAVADDARALARFERETRALAALSHPSILVLHDIGDAADVIVGLTTGMTFEGFAAARPVHDAVLYNLLVIGEAVKRLPSRLTGSRPEVSWQSSARMRDRLVHRYFHV